VDEHDRRPASRALVRDVEPVDSDRVHRANLRCIGCTG
jgi:hypothetical protein